MEIIKFIFSSFWVFIGVIIILDVILSGIAKMFSRKYYKEMVELINHKIHQKENLTNDHNYPNQPMLR